MVQILKKNIVIKGWLETSHLSFQGFYNNYDKLEKTCTALQPTFKLKATLKARGSFDFTEWSITLFELSELI